MIFLLWAPLEVNGSILVAKLAILDSSSTGLPLPLPLPLPGLIRYGGGLGLGLGENFSRPFGIVVAPLPFLLIV